jgi:hypothetical protein
VEARRRRRSEGVEAKAKIKAEAVRLSSKATLASHSAASAHEPQRGSVSSHRLYK